MRRGQVLTTPGVRGASAREAEVVEVRGVNGGPPFLVRWLDTGRTSLLFPDCDVWIEPPTHPRVPQQHGNRCG